jgi:hypothetical protein
MNLVVESVCGESARCSSGAIVCMDGPWKGYVRGLVERSLQTFANNIIARRDTLERLSNTSWWDWEDGSMPHHWKWPIWYLEVIQDGLPVWFGEAPKQWRRP